MEFLSQDWVAWTLWLAAMFTVVMLYSIARSLERILFRLEQINEREQQSWEAEIRRRRELEDDLPGL